MKKFSFMVTILFAFIFIGCDGGSGGSDTPSPIKTTTSPNTISGIVNDDPVPNAQVYLLFEDGTKSTQATTNSDGSYELKLSSEDLAKINPKIPEGADGPKDDLIIVAEKNGKILRNAIDRDVAEGKEVYITNDTEAYAEFLEAIGEFSASALVSFNSELEKGRIKSSSELSAFIEDIREDIKSYFNGGEKPTANSLFEKAFTNLGEEKLAKMSDHSSYVAHRNVMSGGDIILPSNVTVESDDITLTPKGNGRFTVGDGFDGDITAYLKIVDDGVYRLIPIFIKERQVTTISSGVVTPQKGEKIGTDGDSISATIPPYALLTNKTITFNKIESEGETADGKMILDMQPSGLKFDLPITVKVKYSDFGVNDPEAVEWKYGSVDGGYEDADIANIDKDSGFIYLNVSHFSNLVVREIKSQKYLDLGYHFVIVTPRRDHNTSYTNLIYGKRTYITNRLFNGTSISTLNTESSIGGGQCVQYAKYFHYPIKYGVVGLYYSFASSSQAKNIAVKIRKDIKNKTEEKQEEYFEDKGIRVTASECKKDDILLMNFNTSTGHIAILEKDVKSSDTKISVINSNWFPFIHRNKTKKYIYGKKDEPSYRYSSGGWHHERFGIDKVAKSYAISNSNNKYELSLTKSTYLCLANPDVDNNGKYEPENGDEDASNYISFIAGTKNANPYSTVFNNENTKVTEKYNTYGIKVTHKPWMYYLLDTKGDGVSITNEKKSGAKYYGYEPDILPVASLKLDSNYKLTSDVESRYEIYVSESLKNNKFKLTAFSSAESKANFETDISVTTTTLSFSGNKLYKLKKDDNTTEFKLLPLNGVENFESRYELRTPTDESEVDENKKVLFSPNIIDDYYVNWSKDNKYDTSKILIGFWNSYGYDLELANENSQNCEIPSPLVGGRIYKTCKAVNGYFMTLEKGESAEWHFSLAGAHAIFVHVPTGKYSDIENAEYKYKDITGTEHTLKPKSISQKLNDSGFENWFILYEEKDGKKHYGFNLGGSESLKVTAKDGTVVVDAIRLQGRASLEEDLTAKGTVTLSDKDDINDVVIKIVVKDEKGKVVAETKTNASEVENVNIVIPKTSHSSFYYFFYLPFAPYINYTINNKQEKSYRKISQSTVKQVGGSSSKNEPKYYRSQKIISNSTTFLAYTPSKLTIKVKENDTEINLPKVVLQKSEFVDTFTFNITDGSSTALSGVNIDIKYGINNESEFIAYSGTTDSLGKFEINQLAYGQYTAILSLGGYAPKVINFTVSDTQTSISEKMMVAQGSTLEGLWIADSNHVPNVPQASYKNSISIEKDGSEYKGTYKSVYSWYPNEYCGLLTSTAEADFTATINENYLDLTFTTDSGDVRTECDDGSWVNAEEFTSGQTLRLELNSNDSGILSLKYDACGWNQGGTCEQRMPLFYKLEENAEYIKLEAEISSKEVGNEYITYKFNLLNIDEFPRDILEPLENTPSQCGDNAPRTWLEIFDQNDNYIYGFCAITDFEDLKSKNKWWFSISKDNTTITGVKIKLHDRKYNRYYSSDILEL